MLHFSDKEAVARSLKFGQPFVGDGVDRPAGIQKRTSQKMAARRN
jgi:hypothetical protein